MSIAKISAESPYLWPRSHQRSAISWQLCQRKYLLPNVCPSPCCVKSYSQVSRLSATATLATPMLFHAVSLLPKHQSSSNHPHPTLLKRDATVQISPVFQQYKIYHLGFHVCGRDLNHLLTKSRCSKVCGLLDKAPTSKGLLLK